jgi:hypothetical protein
MAGALLAMLAVLFSFFPKLPAYTLVVVLGWTSLALGYRGYTLYRRGRKAR